MELLIILLVLVIGAGWLILLSYKVKHHQKDRVLNTAVLLVSLPKNVLRKDDENANAQPKDFKEEMAPAEQLFSTLYSIYDESFIAQVTEDQEVLGLEIVSEGNLISFYVTCHRKLIPLIEKHIHSYYPTANVEQVPGHNIFNVGKGDFSTAAIELNKRFIYPIRTFRYLETDPLNELTNSMSKMGPGQSAAVQILIKPISERWRFHPATAAKQVLEGGTLYIHPYWWQRAFHGMIHGLGSMLSGAASSTGGGYPGKDDKGNKSWRQTPGQEDLMKAFNEKASKSAFKTQIRIIGVGPDKHTSQIIRDSMTAAFMQFNSPAWNGFRILKDKDRYRIVTDYILRNFANVPEMILNTEELASLFHLPNRYIETPNIRWLLSKTLPSPPNLPKEGVIIGESVYRGETKPVRFSGEDRRRHLFMIGKTGVGKTTFFENMIDQDIREGKGVCFIDPLGDAVESILKKIPKERAEDVILFDPGDTSRPMGLNLLEWKNPEEKDFLISEWIEIFYKLFDPNRTGIVGPQWEHWGRNAALTVMSLPEGGSLIDVPRLFTDENFQKRAISYVTDPVVKSFWEQQLAKTADFHKSEMYNYFISKFGRFMTNDLMRNIIGQPKSAFDIRQLMDDGKILLINLAKGKIGEMNSNLLGLMIVSKIQTAAFSRANIPEDSRKDFYLYVDEFQNFTTDTFATILSEARKYHLNLNITNQYIAQLSEKIRDAVIGNAGTMVVYRIGAADAEFMAKEFPGVTIDDMVNLDKFRMYTKLLIDLTPSKPFSMKGIKSTIPLNPELGEAIRQLARLKHGRDREEVDSEFSGRMKMNQIAPAGVNEPINKL